METHGCGERGRPRQEIALFSHNVIEQKREMYSRKVTAMLALLATMTVVSFVLLTLQQRNDLLQKPQQVLKSDVSTMSRTGGNAAIDDKGGDEDPEHRSDPAPIYRPGNSLRSKGPPMKLSNASPPSEIDGMCFAADPYKPDLSRYSTDDPDLDTALDKLIDRYLAPWMPLTPSTKRRLVSQRMLGAMELSYKGGAVRIRIHERRIFYRKLVYWRQTYRTERLAWYLAFLRDLVDSNLLAADAKVDFVLYLGDGPKVAADTFTQDAGFPLFSLRTSLMHLDIPVPDATAFGSNGNYQWPAEAKQAPWSERVARAVFRGRASCLKMQADNWHACNRVRALQLSRERPDLLDVGLIEWNQLFGTAKTLMDAPSRDEVEASTGAFLTSPMDYGQQSRFRYILDLDGGLGSSRKPGILSSGSVLIAQQSPWFVHWEPLARPFREYVPVERSLTDLTERVLWLQAHDEQAVAIMQRGRQFADNFTSLSASKLYMAKLLGKYQDLLQLDGWSTDQPVAFDYCQRPGINEISSGPLGCSRGWLEYIGKLPLIVSDDRSHFE
jgi:hypothetical protein